MKKRSIRYFYMKTSFIVSWVPFRANLTINLIAYHSRGENIERALNLLMLVIYLTLRRRETKIVQNCKCSFQRLCEVGMSEKLWNQKYLDALKHGENAVKSTEGVITAFNTNIDALHFVRSGEVRKILEVNSDLEREVLRKLVTPPSKIERIADFLAGLLYAMRLGCGMELTISRKETSEWIRSAFKIDEIRMGGQAGIMANVLANLGVKNVHPHVSQLSSMQAELFVKSASIKVPTFKEEKVIMEKPSRVFREKDEPLIHLVFEFSKGTRVKINSTTVVSPNSNRLIATWDEFNSRLSIDSAFSIGTKRIIKNVDKAMISGYQLLRRDYPDKTTYRDHVDNSVELISSWKKLNPKLKIHFEQAFLRDPEIIRYVFDEVFPYVDGFGVNENELCSILEAYGFNDLAKEIKSRFAAPCLYDGMEKLFDLIKVSRIDLHTRDFAISLLKPNYGITPRTEQNALLFGALCAATRALTGQFGNLEEINNASASPRLHLNELGLKEHERFSRKVDTLGLSTKGEFFKSGIATADDHWIIYIVTKITDNPVSTVGLGDCITAGLIVGEIE